MRCERCGFENMPGLTICVRCSSALVSERSVSVEPPRAGWTRVFRPLGYGWNRLFGFSVKVPCERLAAAFPDWEMPAPKNVAAVLLSVLPGLGHAVTGRFCEARMLAISWGISIVFGLLFYGSRLGAYSIAGAAAVHAWIICDAGKLRWNFTKFVARVALVLAIFFLVYFGLYGGIRHAVGAQVRFLTAPYGIPALEIREGDGLLAWRDAYRRDSPLRGDAILYRLRGGRVSIGPGRLLDLQGEFLGIVAGMPGENVRTEDGRIVLTRDGATVAEFDFPAPFQPFPIDRRLDADSYFVLPAGNPYRLRPSQEIFRSLILASRNGIEDRVFMLYNPIWRRHFLRREPVSQ